jgi:hypothetical protein
LREVERRLQRLQFAADDFHDLRVAHLYGSCFLVTR